MIKMNHLDQFLHSTHIAYFTVEIALRPEIHTYSGGLGVLAGDMARSCADLELPVVFVSLISRAGYLRQKVNGDGCQIDLADPWEPSEWMQPLDAMVAVAIEGHEVWIRPWLYSLSCPMGHPFRYCYWTPIFIRTRLRTGSLPITFMVVMRPIG